MLGGASGAYEGDFEPQTHRSGNGPTATDIVWFRGRICGSRTASKHPASRRAGVRGALSVADGYASTEHISLVQRLEARPERSRAKRLHVVDHIRDLTLLVTEKHSATPNPTLLQSRADA
jgi:hypothetical protein